MYYAYTMFVDSPLDTSASVGLALRFPSLINCATVDWYDPWPQVGHGGLDRAERQDRSSWE